VTGLTHFGRRVVHGFWKGCSRILAAVWRTDFGSELRLERRIERRPCILMPSEMPETEEPVVCVRGYVLEPREVTMLVSLKKAGVASAGLAMLATASLAQPAPSPGPVKPPPPTENPSGKSIVINPTDEECKRGWEPSMRWTKEQFNDFCGKLGASK
jgi:hypothetical protein